MGGQKKASAKKVALFLSLGGTAVIDFHSTFDFGTAAETVPEPDSVWNTVMSKLDEYFAPRENQIRAKYAFRCRMQGVSESLDLFLTDLRLRSGSYNSELQTDKMIRD